MNIEKTWRVLLPPAAHIEIILVGVGGTGSHLAPAIAGVMHHCRERQDDRITLTLIDHDSVEARNIGRQNFCHAEIGLNKAQSMAWRINAALGLKVAAFPEPFQAAKLNHYRTDVAQPQTIRLLIGCVDNHLARRELADCIDNNHGAALWWLDCGNAYNNGHVTIGNSNRFAFPDLDVGLLEVLPAPHIQEPALLQPDIDTPTLSCADLTIREEQSVMVNRMVAAIAADVVGSFVLRRELQAMATYFNLTPPIARSIPLTKSHLTRFLHNC